MANCTNCTRLQGVIKQKHKLLKKKVERLNLYRELYKSAGVQKLVTEKVSKSSQCCLESDSAEEILVTKYATECEKYSKKVLALQELVNNYKVQLPIAERKLEHINFVNQQLVSYHNENEQALGKFKAYLKKCATTLLKHEPKNHKAKTCLEFITNIGTKRVADVLRKTAKEADDQELKKRCNDLLRDIRKYTPASSSSPESGIASTSDVASVTSCSSIAFPSNDISAPSVSSTSSFDYNTAKDNASVSKMCCSDVPSPLSSIPSRADWPSDSEEDQDHHNLPLYQSSVLIPQNIQESNSIGENQTCAQDLADNNGNKHLVLETRGTNENFDIPFSELQDFFQDQNINQSINYYLSDLESEVNISAGIVDHPSSSTDTNGLGCSSNPRCIPKNQLLSNNITDSVNSETSCDTLNNTFVMSNESNFIDMSSKCQSPVVDDTVSSLNSVSESRMQGALPNLSESDSSSDELPEKTRYLILPKEVQKSSKSNIIASSTDLEELPSSDTTCNEAEVTTTSSKEAIAPDENYLSPALLKRSIFEPDNYDAEVLNASTSSEVNSPFIENNHNAVKPVSDISELNTHSSKPDGDLESGETSIVFTHFSKNPKSSNREPGSSHCDNKESNLSHEEPLKHHRAIETEHPETGSSKLKFNIESKNLDNEYRKPIHYESEESRNGAVMFQQRSSEGSNSLSGFSVNPPPPLNSGCIPPSINSSVPIEWHTFSKLREETDREFQKASFWNPFVELYVPPNSDYHSKRMNEILLDYKNNEFINFESENLKDIFSNIPFSLNVGIPLTPDPRTNPFRSKSENAPSFLQYVAPTLHANFSKTEMNEWRNPDLILKDLNENIEEKALPLPPEVPRLKCGDLYTHLNKLARRFQLSVAVFTDSYSLSPSLIKVEKKNPIINASHLVFNSTFIKEESKDDENKYHPMKGRPPNFPTIDTCPGMFSGAFNKTLPETNEVQRSVYSHSQMCDNRFSHSSRSIASVRSYSHENTVTSAGRPLRLRESQLKIITFKKIDCNANTVLGQLNKPESNPKVLPNAIKYNSTSIINRLTPDNVNISACALSEEKNSPLLATSSNHIRTPTIKHSHSKSDYDFKKNNSMNTGMSKVVGTYNSADQCTSKINPGETKNMFGFIKSNMTPNNLPCKVVSTQKTFYQTMGTGSQEPLFSHYSSRNQQVSIPEHPRKITLRKSILDHIGNPNKQPVQSDASGSTNGVLISDLNDKNVSGKNVISQHLNNSSTCQKNCDNTNNSSQKVIQNRQMISECVIPGSYESLSPSEGDTLNEHSNVDENCRPNKVISTVLKSSDDPPERVSGINSSIKGHSFTPPKEHCSDHDISLAGITNRDKTPSKNIVCGKTPNKSFISEEFLPENKFIHTNPNITKNGMDLAPSTKKNRISHYTRSYDGAQKRSSTAVMTHKEKELSPSSECKIASFQSSCNYMKTGVGVPPLLSPIKGETLDVNITHEKFKSCGSNSKVIPTQLKSSDASVKDGLVSAHTYSSTHKCSGTTPKQHAPNNSDLLVKTSNRGRKSWGNSIRCISPNISNESPKHKQKNEIINNESPDAMVLDDSDADFSQNQQNKSSLSVKKVLSFHTNKDVKIGDQEPPLCLKKGETLMANKILGHHKNSDKNEPKHDVPIKVNDVSFEDVPVFDTPTSNKKRISHYTKLSSTQSSSFGEELQIQQKKLPSFQTIHPHKPPSDIPVFSKDVNISKAEYNSPFMTCEKNPDPLFKVPRRAPLKRKILSGKETEKVSPPKDHSMEMKLLEETGDLEKMDELLFRICEEEKTFLRPLISPISSPESAKSITENSDVEMVFETFGTNSQTSKEPSEKFFLKDSKLERTIENYYINPQDAIDTSVTEGSSKCIVVKDTQLEINIDNNKNTQDFSDTPVSKVELGKDCIPVGLNEPSRSIQNLQSKGMKSDEEEHNISEASSMKYNKNITDDKNTTVTNKDDVDSKFLINNNINDSKCALLEKEEFSLQNNVPSLSLCTSNNDNKGETDDSRSIKKLVKLYNANQKSEEKMRHRSEPSESKARPLRPKSRARREFNLPSNLASVCSDDQGLSISDNKDFLVEAGKTRCLKQVRFHNCTQESDKEMEHDSEARPITVAEEPFKLPSDVASVGSEGQTLSKSESKYLLTEAGEAIGLKQEIFHNSGEESEREMEHYFDESESKVTPLQPISRAQDQLQFPSNLVSVSSEDQERSRCKSKGLLLEAGEAISLEGEMFHNSNQESEREREHYFEALESKVTPLQPTCRAKGQPNQVSVSSKVQLFSGRESNDLLTEGKTCDMILEEEIQKHDSNSTCLEAKSTVLPIFRGFYQERSDVPIHSPSTSKAEIDMTFECDSTPGNADVHPLKTSTKRASKRNLPIQPANSNNLSVFSSGSAYKKIKLNVVECPRNLFVSGLKYAISSEMPIQQGSRPLRSKRNTDKKKKEEEIKKKEEEEFIKSQFNKVLTASHKDALKVANRVARTLKDDPSLIVDPRFFSILIRDILLQDNGKVVEELPYMDKDAFRCVALTVVFIGRQANEFLLDVLRGIEEVLGAYHIRTLTLEQGVRLASFYTSVCKAYDLQDRVRNTIYDVLYSRGYNCYGIILKILKIWPTILLNRSHVIKSDCLLTKTIIMILLTMTMTRAVRQCNKFQVAYNASTLKEFLRHSYGFTSKEFSINYEVLVDKLLENISEEGSRKALVLLAQRQQAEWTKVIQEKKFFPLIRDWTEDKVPAPIALHVLLTAAKMIRGMPISFSVNFINKTLELFEEILHKSPDEYFAEGVIEAISLLRRHNLLLCATLLMKFVPPSKNVTENTMKYVKWILSAQNVKQWKLIYKKCTVNGHVGSTVQSKGRKCVQNL